MSDFMRASSAAINGIERPSTVTAQTPSLQIRGQ
jgi:hypothetical protein